MRLNLEAFQREVETLRESSTAHTSVLADARREADAQRSAAEQGLQKLDAAEHRHRLAMHTCSEQALFLEELLARTQEDAQATLAAIHASTSWRITAPLRRLKRWLS